VKTFHKYTKEEIEFITKNVIGVGNNELAELVNKKFNLNLTSVQVTTFKKNRGLKSGLDGRFKKGEKVWNKGMKGLQIGGKETQFKKGQTPINYREVGSERINVDGYTEIKVADPNRWRAKHVVVWENEKGSVPNGHVILFGDRNRLNVDIDNLILVSRKQLVTLNKHNLIKHDADLTKSGILVADIFSRLSQLKKG